MKFTGKVDWWKRDLLHRVRDAVLSEDETELTLDLEDNPADVWTGKMRRVDAKYYKGSFRTRDGKYTADASGYLTGPVTNES
jgi:hypothetical protein